MINPIADLIDAGAREVERRGWIQYSYSGEGGRVCGFGGVIAAAGFQFTNLDFRNSTEANEILQAMNELDAYTGGDFINYNDTEGRTQEEVTSQMRATAALLRMRETSPREIENKAVLEPATAF